MTVFETLNSLNVNEHTEKKKVDGKTELTYLSWPWAWAEVKKRYPDAHYEIKRGKNGLPYSCDPITGYMVFTSVTIDGITHDMWLPVMDGANNAMKQSEYTYYVKNPNYKFAKQEDDGKYYDKYGNEQPQFFEKKVKAATMFDINKTIMRCLVKNLAMFGLGLYIYAGEDLPEGEEQEQPKAEPVQATKVKSLKILMEKAMLAYGMEKAPERFEMLMKRAGCTKETMNEHYYDQIDAWIESDLKKGAA